MARRQTAASSEADCDSWAATFRNARRGSRRLIIYFDASSLVKLFVDEDDSDDLHARHDRASATVTSRIAYAEGRAAFARRVRDGSMTATDVPLAVEGLRAWFMKANVVAFDDVIADLAGTMADQHGLRALDAIHLASLIAVRDFRPEVILACADRRLGAAARAEGFSVV